MTRPVTIAEDPARAGDALSMRASVLQGRGQVSIEMRPRPVPARREVLIRVASVGVCGSDVHYFSHGGIGEHIVRSPMILGHEASGTVVGVGADVSPSWLGKRISIEPGVPDGTCSYCRAGRYNLCLNMRFFATPPVDGAFVEYLAHPVDYVYELPDSVSDDAGGLLEPLSVGIWSARQARLRPAGSVFIAGAGPIGLMVAQLARASGLTDIVVSDVSEYRRSVAGASGATAVLDPRSADPAGLDAEAFIDCSGNPAAIASGISALRPGGIAVLVGIGHDAVSLPMGTVQDRELTIKGIFRYANTWPDAVRMVADGSVDLDSLVTGHYDLDHVVDALSGDHGGTSIKSVVCP